MISPREIRSSLSAVLTQSLVLITGTSQTAYAFAKQASAIPDQVLLRHAIEHVFRIRMFRRLDALATKMLRDIDPEVRDLWAAYARSEAVHDRYFLRDLSAAGIDRDTVDSTPPFSATSRLVSFLELSSRQQGALPIILYSFWAELNSEVGSSAVIARSQRLFGADAARGALAHRNLDAHLDHAGTICRILSAVIRNEDELLTAAHLLRIISLFIGEYFAELDAWSRCNSSYSPAFGSQEPKLHEA